MQIIPFTARPRPAVQAAPQIGDLIAGYARSCASDGQRPRGVARYQSQLRSFAAFVGQTPAAAITAAQCRRYQEHLAGAGAAGSSRQVSLSAMRSFFAWCVVEGIRMDNPALSLHWPRRDDPPRRTPDAAQLAQLNGRLRALDGATDRPTRRNVRAVQLMRMAGLRISEVAALDWTSVDMDRRLLSVVGKGGRRRELPINRALMRELARVPPDERVGAVCPTDAGRPFSGPKTFARAVIDHWLRRDLGVELTAHQLRHAFARRLLDTGADVRRIQLALGHASLETTQIYLGMDAEDLRDAIERLDE